jgi:hypothetical protein
MFAFLKTNSLSLASQHLKFRPSIVAIGSTRMFSKEIIESNEPLIDKSFMSRELAAFSKLPVAE